MYVKLGQNMEVWWLHQDRSIVQVQDWPRNGSKWYWIKKLIRAFHIYTLSCCIFHVLQDDVVHIDIADSANIVYLSCCICTCISSDLCICTCVSSVLVVGFWTFIVTLYHALFLRFTINDTHAKFKKITCVKYRNVL